MPTAARAHRRGAERSPPQFAGRRRARRASRGRSPARCAARGCSPTTTGFAAHFEQALRLHAQTPDAFEAARTRLAYGERLRRARNRVLAREQLRAAADAFERLDARPWADRARTELAATGETRRRRDPSTIDELTPQELQIALLLAGGKTTREAAAALFLSPKTVEYHLRHVYQKLGIHSRDELAHDARRAGIPNERAGQHLAHLKVAASLPHPLRPQSAVSQGSRPEPDAGAASPA